MNQLKRIIRYGIIGIGILLLIYATAMSIMANFNAGVLALALFSIGVIIYGVIIEKLERVKWLHGIIGAGCCLLLVFSGFLAYYGHSNNVQYDEDIVIILGAGIRGEEVTPILRQRLDKAVEYYEKNPQAILIVSGGQGPQESITEALAMERYLIAQGIPTSQIIKEEKSTSTYENFKFSKELIEEKFSQGYTAVLITNSFHVYRAERIAKSVGISARHLGAKTLWYTIPVNYMREMMAVVKTWIFP